MEKKLQTNSGMDLVEKIKEGDEQAIEGLYRDYRNPFLNWARNSFSGCTEEEVIDVFQESVLTFYFNIRENKLQEIKSSVKSYLFGIGKNKLFDLSKKRYKRDVPLDLVSDFAEQVGGLDGGILDKYDHNHQKEIIRSILGKLEKKCKAIIELSFFKNYPPEAIAKEFDFKTEQVARVAKVRCLKKLKGLFQQAAISRESL